MNTRRKFFVKCAAFVAGCAFGVGLSRKNPLTCSITDHPLVADPGVVMSEVKYASMDTNHEFVPVFICLDGSQFFINKSGQPQPVDLKKIFNEQYVIGPAPEVANGVMPIFFKRERS